MPKAHKQCVIFGGKGYIGSFFAAYLLDAQLYDKIYLVDISESKRKIWPAIIEHALYDGRIILIKADVRHEINVGDLPVHCDLVCNFAAIHREPGHEDKEYFETNLNGAINVCAWSEEIGCKKIIFTSSIAPYGPTEDPKDESSLPVPITPYGASKLVAEKIHIAWQQQDTKNHKLVIVRPGVVFGPGEDGNVTRLIHAVLGRYFLFLGNKETIKAGIYVNELCHAMNWVLKNQETTGERISLFNMSMNPAPSIKEYVYTISKVAGVKRYIPSVPYALIYPLSFVIDLIFKAIRINQPINPVRVRKLVKSNNIVPAYLETHGYIYQFTLQSAFEDWKKDSPKDWK